MDVARWIGLVVAVLGMCLLFSDLIINIKKRRNTRLNVIGFVFLTLSLVCYVLTQFVFTNLSSMMTFIWIPFLVGYLVCDVIVAICIGKENARKKQEKQLQQEDSSEVAEK